MSDRRVIESELVPIYQHDEFERAVDARELHQFLQVGRDFSTWIKQKLGESSAADGLDFSPVLGKSTGGRPGVEYWLTVDLAKEVAMLEGNEIGKRVRRYFIEVEKRCRQMAPASLAPTSPAHLALMMAQQLVEQEKRLVALQEQVTVANHRIDSLDTINIDGTLRQRLEKMVKRYAWQNGIQFPAGWKAFDQAFNTAYHTNLTTLRQNFAATHEMDEIGRPEYLERTNRLEDAIRVADKMLARHQNSG